MKLGEHFPPGEKLAHVRRSLKPGAVLRLFCPFTTPPKEKYCILVCIEPQPVVFVVNSEISRWLRQRPALRDCQVTLHHEQHPFLEHDSYVNCTHARMDFSLQEIEEQLIENLDKLKDHISEGERDGIIYAVEAGKTIEQRVK